MTDILALDIATVTGYARGKPGEAPIAGSIRFAAPNASNNAVFFQALLWIAKVLEPQPRPDLLVLEAMLSPQAKVGKTSKDVRDRLAGLHGIVRAVAHWRGVYNIDEHRVGAVRHHFIGEPMAKRQIAKAETMLRCRQLGWVVEDDNAADACALWSLACSLIDPTQALKLSPLFNKQLRAVVQ